MGKKSQKKNQMKKNNANKSEHKTKRITYKPQTVAEFNQNIKVQAHDIKNKIKRVEVNAKRRLVKNQLKMK